MRVLILHDHVEPSADLVEALARHHQVEALRLSGGGSLDPAGVLLCVVDADLQSGQVTRALRERLPELGQDMPLLFFLDLFDRRRFMIAQTLGARDFLVRPLDPVRVQKVLGDHVSGRVEATWNGLNPLQTSALRVSLRVFEALTASATAGLVIDHDGVVSCAQSIVTALSSVDLKAWIDSLRDHHRYTFKHVMFVTGSLASFGQVLGFGSGDIRNIVLAGLLHDVGKARVPIEILDKPGKLDAEEWKIMRQHPRYGAEILEGANWSSDVCDAVLHHHERLDGAGYPDGLRGAQVTDIARLTAITDVYSALVDKRAYKDGMSGPEAHELMRTFDGHLDGALLKAFRPVAYAVK